MDADQVDYSPTMLAQAVKPGASRGTQAAMWITFLGLTGASIASLYAGNPVLSVMALLLLLVFAFSDVLFRWVSGVSLLLLVLTFVPSRIYELPVNLPFDLEPYRLVLLLLLALLFIQSVVQRGFVPVRSYLGSATALYLLAVLATSAAHAPQYVVGTEFEYGVKQAANLLSYPLTLFLVTSTIRRRSDALQLIDLLVICGGIAGIFAILERVTQYNVFYNLESFIPVLQHVQAPTTEMRGAIRVAGATAHPIAFSTVMSMLLGLAIARAFGSVSSRMRGVYFACSGLIGVGVLLALSRTGIVGIGVAGLVLMAGFPSRRRLLVVSAVGLLGGIHLFFRGVIGTLLLAFTPGFISAAETGNENGRIADYAWAAPQVMNHPLFGSGLGSLNPARGARIIDNQYMMSLVETGVLGLTAFAYMLWRAVSVPLSAGRRMGGEVGATLIGIAAASAVFAATSATFDTMGFPQVPYLFFVLAGLATALLNQPVDVEADEHGAACDGGAVGTQ